MAGFYSDYIKIPAGWIRITLINDNGDSGSYDLTGNYFLTLAMTTQAVEELGIGGVPIIGDMELEVNDIAGKFKDEILKKNTVTYCYAEIIFYNQNPQDYNSGIPIITGHVDLTTIEYEYYYKDSDSEYHTCKFIIFDIAKKIQETSAEQLRLYSLVPNATTRSTLFGDAYTVCMKLTDIIKYTIQYCTGINVSTVESFVSPDQTYMPPLSDYLYGVPPGVERQYQKFENLYTPVANSANTKSIIAIDENSQTAFRDAYELMKAICADHFVYPIIKHDLVSNTFNCKLKQRVYGEIKNEPSGLISSLEIPFNGYNALRIQYGKHKMSDTPPYGWVEKDFYFPYDCLPDVYDAIESKFDYTAYFSTNYRESDNANYGLLYLDDRWDRFGMIEFIRDVRYLQQSTAPYSHPEYSTVFFNEYIRNVMARYWCNTQYGIYGYSKLIFPTALDNTYHGLNLDIELLDRMTIDGTNYTVTEIKRDLIENTTNLKLVSY